MVSIIIEKSETLHKFPKIGRTVPELEDESIRELIIYSYRMIYEIVKDENIIHAVIHGKRNLESAFKPSSGVDEE